MTQFKFVIDRDKQKTQYYDAKSLDETKGIDTSMISKMTWLVNAVSQSEIAFSTIIEPSNLRPVIALVLRGHDLGSNASNLRPGSQIRGSGIASTIESYTHVTINEDCTSERGNYYTIELNN